MNKIGLKLLKKQIHLGRISKIKVGNKTLNGNEARTVFGLKSTKFELNVDGDYIYFDVLGYGHGVGLSHCGSDSLARQGKSAEEIVKHYYKDVEISE